MVQEVFVFDLFFSFWFLSLLLHWAVGSRDNNFVFTYIFHLVQKPLLFFSTYLTIDDIYHSVKVLPTPGCFTLATDYNLGVQHVLKVHKTLFLAFP